MEKNVRRKILLALSSAAMLTSCAHYEENNDWLMDEEALSKTLSLKVKQEVFGDSLIAKLSYSGIKFSDTISKENILVHPTKDKENISTLSYDVLKENQIEDYSFSLNATKSELTINIPNYDGSDQYDFVVNAKGSSHTSFLEARLGNFESVIDNNVTSQISVVENSYYIGQTNPSFTFEFRNDYIVGDREKISFSGAFEDLNVSDIYFNDSILIVYTTGTIVDNGDGLISFKEGLFKKGAYGGRLHVDKIVVAVDDSSFALKDGHLTFDIEATGDLFEYKQKNYYYIINGKEMNASSVTISKDRKKATISVVTKATKLDDAIKEYKGHTISIDEKALAYASDVTIIKIGADSPTLYSSAVMDGHNGKLTLDFFLTNGSFSKELTKDDIEFTGDLKGIVPTSITGNKDSYSIEIPWNKSNFPIADVIVKGDGIKTSWGTNFSRAQANIASSGSSSSTYDEAQDKFEEGYSKIGKSGETWAGTVIDTVGYIVTIVGGGFSIGEKNLGSGLAEICEGVMGLLEVYGVDSSDSTEPKLIDVMNKLNRMDNKLDNITNTVARLGNQIKEESAAIQAGINKIEYQQNRSDWENFALNELASMDELKTKYIAKKNEYITKFISGTTGSVNLVYIDGKDDNGNTIKQLTSKNSLFEDKAVDGTTITKKEKVTFSDIGNTFKKSREVCASLGGGYSSEVETAIKEDLLKYAEDSLKDNVVNISTDPNYTLTEAMVYANSIYFSLLDDATLYATKQGAINDYIPRFETFCDAITGKNVRSRIDVFYDMLTCLYNFKSEVDFDLKTFKLTMKKKLLDFYNFGLVAIRGTSYDSTEYANKFKSALKFIDEYDPSVPTSSDGVYCFATNSIVGAKLVYGFVELDYEDKNTPKARLTRDFIWEDAITGKKVNVKDNPNLLDDNDMKKIEARKNNIKKFCADKASGNDEAKTLYNDSNSNLYTYLLKKGVISNSINNNANLSKEMITSYGGERDITDKDKHFVLVKKGDGASKYYFQEGVAYKYGYSTRFIVEDCWDGCEYTASFYNLENGSSDSRIINAAAWYSEDHWWWGHAEKYALVWKKSGTYALAFYKG